MIPQSQPQSQSPNHPCSAAGDLFLDFLTCGHRCVTRGCRRERAVGSAVLHGLLWVVEFEKTELNARGEAIAAADPIKDFQIIEFSALVESSLVPEDCAPIIACRGDHTSQGGRSNFEIGKFFHCGLDH